LIESDQINISKKMKCPVKFCCNVSPKKGESSEIKWYYFPTKKDSRELWLKACGKSEIGKDMKVCSSHFSENDFEKHTKKRTKLTSHAVPKGSALLILIKQGRHQDFNPTKAKIQNFNRS
jgi:hypothetical protein